MDSIRRQSDAGMPAVAHNDQKARTTRAAGAKFVDVDKMTDVADVVKIEDTIPKDK